MSTYETNTSNRVGRIISAIIKFTARLILLLLLGIGMGAGLYWGVPWVYHSLVSPVQETQTRVQALEQRFDREGTQRANDLSALQERVTHLEVENSALREALTAQDEDYTAALERLQGLEQHLAAVEGQLTEQQTARDALSTRLNNAVTTLDTRTQQTETRITTLQARLAALYGGQALMQAAQDVLKAQLLMLEENPRAARGALALAGARLTVAEQLRPDQAASLADLQNRVTALDTLFAANSARIVPELEALWAAIGELLTLEVTGPTPQPTLSPLTPPPPPAP